MTSWGNFFFLLIFVFGGCYLFYTFPENQLIPMLLMFIVLVLMYILVELTKLNKNLITCKEAHERQNRLIEDGLSSIDELQSIVRRTIPEEEDEY